VANPKPSKQFNKSKPFKRINNDSFIVKANKKPNGDGKDCGCRPDVGDEAQLKKDLAGPLLSHLSGPLGTIFAGVRGLQSVTGFVNKISPIVALIPGVGPAIAAGNAILNKVLTLATDATDFIVISLASNTFDRALRVIPEWAPVKKGASNHIVEDDQMVEMEGIATRSFGNPVEVPFQEWHRWFDWNVQVAPEPEYLNAQSPANNPPDQRELQTDDKPITKNNAFVIQIDPGILRSSADQADLDGRAMAEVPEMEKKDAPFLANDWCWPQTGMFVWAAGRHVYDCSRTTAKDPKNPKKPVLMCAMINPARALATARWGATTFPDQAHAFAVPAIQFMFVASKEGGYLDFSATTDQDYEFILDLPPGPVGSSPFPIGHTGSFPRNTIVLRSQLLRKVEPLQGSDVALFEPVIEPIFGADLSQPPQQVKVTIPLASRGTTPATARKAGFLLSLGWYDGDKSQAKQVKLCTLTLTKFTAHKGKMKRDDAGKALRDRVEKELVKQFLNQVSSIGVGNSGKTVASNPALLNAVQNLAHTINTQVLAALPGLAGQDEEWLMRFGLNGVWRNSFQPGVDSKTKALPPITFPTIALGPEDQLSFSMSGIEMDPVGDMMRLKHSDRVVKVALAKGATPTEVKPWEKVFNPDDQDPAKAKDLRVQMLIDYVGTVMEKTSFTGLDNEPLGFLDPDPAQATAAPNSNPRLMKGVADDTTPFSQMAKFARATDEERVLVEATKTEDYLLEGTLTIASQKT